MKKIVWNEKRKPLVSILGDSISTLEGYNPEGYGLFYAGEDGAKNKVFSPADTWWGQVIEAIGGELLVNNSWAGSRMSRDPGNTLYNHGCNETRTGALGKDGKMPDLVMIFMGINDLGSHKMHMLPDVPGDTGTIQVFSVAYETALKAIRENYPAAKILCITPGRAVGSKPDPTIPDQELRRGAMCGIIKALATQYDCFFFDLSDEAPYESLDGLHPTANGMKSISKGVLSALR